MMSAASVTPLSRTAKPGAAKLGQQVDDLFELRTLIRQSQEAERRLTLESRQAMEATGTNRLQGAAAVAVLDGRDNLTVDPQLFLEAVGDRAWSAIRVVLTEARAFLGEEDLRAIGETTTTPILRVEVRKAVAS
jgi:hypothetical protein